ncbi:hypothetical protein Dimus_010062 [Dionaea muscipula]
MAGGGAMGGPSEEPPRPAAAVSPTNSQQTVLVDVVDDDDDDDEIDYSITPEFYDSELDDKDDLWVSSKRRGRYSDSVLSCPACFTTLCFDCQRHETYLTQYRAMFVVNCKIKNEQVVPRGSSHKRKRQGKEGEESEPSEGSSSHTTTGAVIRQVCCEVCSTVVGVFDDEEVYHFYDVIPSEC